MKVFGIDLSEKPVKIQFATLAGGALISALTFAFLQEKVFRVPDFHFGGFLSLITSLVYCVCSGIEQKGAVRKGSLQYYALLALTTSGGMYFTNWSLEYLNYPTRIMFKSSKVIPVMVVGALMQGKSYTAVQYGNAMLLVAGITVFVLGEVEVSPTFSFVGIFLILVGVGCDAITSNFEERYFFKEAGCSHAEVICYSSMFASMITFVTIAYTGELSKSLAHANDHPEVIRYSVISAVGGYLAVAFVLLLIKHFGATAAEVVKSVRKVISILLSYMLLSKPFTSAHMIGGLLFVGSIVIGARSKALRDGGK